MGSNTATDLAIEHERVSFQRAYRDDEPVEAPHAILALRLTSRTRSPSLQASTRQPSTFFSLLVAGTAERLGDERRLHAGDAG